MANHALPTVSSTYTNFVSELSARMNDIALGLNPSHTTVTNQPTNAIRYNGGSTKWERWTGTAWTDLAATYAISITGNAGTATNGVVTTGSYANPSWITSLAGSKISGNIAGNAGTATTLATARTINGVSFNGSANISVNVDNAITFNNGGSGAASGTTFNGSAARTISYNTVGAPSTTGANASGTWGISITGNAATATSALSATNATTATTLQNARNINGVSFNGSADITLPTVNTSGNQTIGGVKTFSSQGRFINGSATDWNNRTILLEQDGGSQPGIGFHAPSTNSAGIFKFWGPGNIFECRNSADSAFFPLAASNMFGYSQGYNTGGRSFDVNYFNTTSKPIVVHTVFSKGLSTGETFCQAFINGQLAGMEYLASGGTQGAVTLIVLPGSFYSFNKANAVGVDIIVSELA
jgi:hypothetical protein